MPGPHPGPGQGRTQVEQRELGSRPSTVSARPEVAEIIARSQRVRAGLDLREKTQHEELECSPAAWLSG